MNGQLHREDGPAVERANGDKIWFLNGKHHRENGPAIEIVNGAKIWYKRGKLHREDGPAIEYVYGTKEWFLNGQLLSKEEWEKKTQYHTVTIDGKEIELSKESYKNLKQVIGK